jgi:2-keto-4-pentenoate hydratase
MTQLDDATSAFVVARAARPHWPGVPMALRPTTIAEGYHLQRTVHTRLATQGIQRVGYKIGSTSPANQRPWGLDEPVYAGIFTDTRAETMTAALARPLLRPSLECEVAFRLGRDIDGADPALATGMIIDAIAACHIACEIIDGRYDAPMDIGVLTLLADDFFHAGFVLGAPHPGWRVLSFGTLEGTIEIDGVRTSGNAADTLDALTAMLWLARKLAEAGTRLCAGEIVLTGSFTKPVPITLPAHAVALTITGFEPLALSLRHAEGTAGPMRQ